MTEEELDFYDPERMMTTQEVMVLLGVSRATIHVMRKEGLRFMKVSEGTMPGVRFRRGDVLDYRDTWKRG